MILDLPMSDNGSTILLCVTIFVIHKHCLIRAHCSIVTVDTYVQRGFCFVVLVLGADTLIKILQYCPILPCFQHIAPLHAALPGILARKSCPAVLPGSLARQSCPAALPGSLARQSCPAALPGSLARQPCPAALPGSLAPQPCPAALPCSLDRQLCPAVLH
jgi:hypothetical protein